MALGTRVVATAAIVTATVAALAGCGGSSGVNAQNGPTAPDSASTSRALSGSSTPTPTASSSSSYIPPTPYGTAAPAVAAYLRINDQYNAALKSPAKFSPTTFANSTAGVAK